MPVCKYDGTRYTLSSLCLKHDLATLDTPQTML